MYICIRKSVKKGVNKKVFVQDIQKMTNKCFYAKNVMHVFKKYMKSYPHFYTVFLA